jgi:hypothetical protein
MFKIVSSAEFSWPIKVQVPVDGRHAEQVFSARFKKVDRDRLVELQSGDPDAEEAFLSEVVVGWEGVGDEQGNPLPFTPENRRLLLNVPYARTAVIEGYFEALGGRRRKN